MEIKTDECGFKYLESLPEEYKAAKNVWPFVTINPKKWNYYELKIGMRYLIYGKETNRYYLMKITKYTKDKDLLNYINSGQIFIVS